MRPPQYTTILLLTGILLTLTACSRLPQAAPPATPTAITPTPTAAPPATPLPTPTLEVVGGTLKIWHSFGEGERTGLAQITYGFQALHPGVLFDVQYVPVNDIARLYQEELGQGRGPDILLAPAELGPGLYAAGMLADLSPIVSSERLAGLNQPALGAAQLNEALIGAPYSIQGVVLYRNKDIITLRPSTWDDLVMLAETSTQGEVIGAILERSFMFSGGNLGGLGGQWMGPDGQPAFNDPTGLAWIELLQSYDRAGPPNYFTDTDLERFRAGTVGWIIDGTWNMRSLAATLGPERLAIDPWPTYKDGRMAGFVTAENLYLNPKSTASPLTVRTFIDYFLSPEAQTFLAEVGRIPAASGVTISDPTTGPLLTQAIGALAGGVTYPVRPEMTTYNLELDVALRSIFEQGVPPAQALDQAAAAINTALTQPTPAAAP